MAKAKKVRTQVCFLLDETQSMLARKKETIQGFNGYLEELKKDNGDEVLFTFTKFNKGGIKTPYKASSVGDVKPLDDSSYTPQDWTPLYDAIGTTICAIESQIRDTDLVIFTILTDGEENSSKEYTLDAVKELIKKCEKKKWKFTFLGVGIDAFAGAGKLGLSASTTFDVGIKNSGVMYASLSKGTTAMRTAYASGGIGAALNMNVLSDDDRKNLKG